MSETTILNSLVTDIWSEKNNRDWEPVVWNFGYCALEPIEEICHRHKVNYEYDPWLAVYYVKTDKILSPRNPAILAHELIHWTARRVDRPTRSYYLEEVVAELGAAKLLRDLGLSLDTFKTVRYCTKYSKSLTKKKLFEAADLATQAVEYLKTS